MAINGGYRPRKGSELLNIYLSHSTKNRKGKEEFIVVLLVQSNENKVDLIFTSLDGLDKLKYRCRVRVHFHNARSNYFKLLKISMGYLLILTNMRKSKLKVFYVKEEEGYLARKITSCQTNGNDVEVNYLENYEVENQFGYKYKENWIRLKETTSLTGFLEKFILVDFENF